MLRTTGIADFYIALWIDAKLLAKRAVMPGTHKEEAVFAAPEDRAPTAANHGKIGLGGPRVIDGKILSNRMPGAGRGLVKSHGRVAAGLDFKLGSRSGCPDADVTARHDAEMMIVTAAARQAQEVVCTRAPRRTKDRRSRSRVVVRLDHEIKRHIVTTAVRRQRNGPAVGQFVDLESAVTRQFHVDIDGVTGEEQGFIGRRAAGCPEDSGNGSRAVVRPDEKLQRHIVAAAIRAEPDGL